MPSRVVELPRSLVIQIAELERDSLGLRAQSSARCAGPWRAAQDQANRVVQGLYVGADAAAGTAAVKVGSAWRKAADCEGWPTPYVAVGETDTEKIEQILRNQAEQASKRRLALTLGALGALIAAARLGIVAIPLIKSAKARPRKK